MNDENSRPLVAVGWMERLVGRKINVIYLPVDRNSVYDDQGLWMVRGER